MKKEYIKPKIVTYGNVAEMTKATGTKCPRDNPKLAGTRVC